MRIEMSIVEQLTFIYKNMENWHRNKLSEAEANVYHERLLVKGNIITYVDKGILKGYLEFWRINFSQLGRIICGQSIMTDVEDITTGNIAYVNNMFIFEDAREGEAFDMLSTMFLVKNKDAEYFTAFRVKKSQPIKVYSRKDLDKLYK